jgi:Putative addiction module component
MFPSLSELLKLPAGERAEIAMALSESLSEGELEFTPEEAAELDRRWMNHVQRPDGKPRRRSVRALTHNVTWRREYCSDASSGMTAMMRSPLPETE